MAGHVFVIQGDITKIACDAWLLPSGEAMFIMPAWVGSAGQSARERIDRGSLRAELPDGWANDGVRTMPIEDWWDDPDGPRTWLTNVGGHPGTPIDWFIDGVEQFLDRASDDLRAAGVQPANRREKHLLALPLVGTGAGGGARRKGEIVGELLPRLERRARELDVDIVLVTFGEEAFAAAQWARRRRDGTGGDANWDELSDGLVQTAERLAEDAVAGQLVLFLGAGVGAAAGLPLWQELLDALAEDVGFDAEEHGQLRRLDVMDQARLLDTRFTAAGRDLGRRVAELVQGRRYALTHGLLASLPTREVVTVNYDRLFEEASVAADQALSILPYDPAAQGQRWLLKLHGSVAHPEDIVLTRSDYLRYAERRAALAGIVQALLITRHMLFVGFSLTDDNFHRIAEDVRRAVRGEDGSDAPSPGRFGTALLLHDDRLMQELWRGDLQCLAMAEEGVAQRTAARRLEIFLDRLLLESTTNSSHLLDDSYEGLLDEEEHALKDLLCDLEQGASPELRRSPVWKPVEELLRDYGWGSGGSGPQRWGERNR